MSIHAALHVALSFDSGETDFNCDDFLGAISPVVGQVVGQLDEDDKGGGGGKRVKKRMGTDDILGAVTTACDLGDALIAAIGGGSK